MDDLLGLIIWNVHNPVDSLEYSAHFESIRTCQINCNVVLRVIVTENTLQNVSGKTIKSLTSNNPLTKVQCFFFKEITAQSGDIS
jgi:hypothetical protein